MFGIINVAIFPVENQFPSVILFFNPFLAHLHSNSSDALKVNTLDEDIRGNMVNRFCNMHGHSPRTSFWTNVNSVNTLESLREKNPFGAEIEILLKQTLEENINTSFDVCELLAKYIGVQKLIQTRVWWEK